MRKSKIKQVREIKIKDIIFYFILPLLLIICIWVLFILYNESLKEFLILFILVTYILLRLLALGSILMYKAFAPMSVRDQCRFEPSCSTYMMIAIRKYGLIIGITMGLNRISRCHYPNGGVDYPKLFKKGEEKHGKK